VLTKSHIDNTTINRTEHKKVINYKNKNLT